MGTGLDFDLLSIVLKTKSEILNPAIYSIGMKGVKSQWNGLRIPRDKSFFSILLVSKSFQEMRAGMV
jgi:hypothetical protein